MKSKRSLYSNLYVFFFLFLVTKKKTYFNRNSSCSSTCRLWASKCTGKSGHTLATKLIYRFMASSRVKWPSDFHSWLCFNWNIIKITIRKVEIRKLILKAFIYSRSLPTRSKKPTWLASGLNLQCLTCLHKTFIMFRSS